MSAVLVITGASRGIGLATANHFAQHGYQVINLSRTKPANHKGAHIAVDLSDPNWLAQSKTEISQAVGSPDRLVVIHNASVLLKDDIRAASNRLAEVLQINVVAAQQLNELLIPLMRPSSSIHYVGSTLSEKAVPNTLSYVTSKHAILGMMRASCQDLMGSGIHCTCVCPGFTDTEMLREHIGHDKAVLEAISKTNSFNRLAKPEELAETLFFAAENPIMNGATLHANLGQRES